MGCQTPKVTSIPPAPWYCSVCHGQESKNCNKTVGQEIRPESTQSLGQDQNSTMAIKASPESESSQKEKSPELSASPLQTDLQQEYTEDICKLEPSTQSAWVAILNPDTPPLSDEAGESPVNQSQNEIETPVQTEASVEKPKPIKLRLGKRANSNLWEKSDSGPSPQTPEIKKPKTRAYVASLAQNAAKSPANVTFPICQQIESFNCNQRGCYKKEG